MGRLPILGRPIRPLSLWALRHCGHRHRWVPALVLPWRWQGLWPQWGQVVMGCPGTGGGELGGGWGGLEESVAVRSGIRLPLAPGLRPANRS